MAKIAIIGAGGYVFPLRLIGDILSHPELQESTLSLMDIDPGRLESTARAARTLVASHRLPTRIEATTDRRRALDGADYVIVTFQIGGLEAYRHDVEIPRRYGVDQTVGDTLGRGASFASCARPRSCARSSRICASWHRLGHFAQIGDDLAQDRGRAQKAKDSSRTEGVADGLVDPVAAGNLDVVPIRLQPANLEGDNDVVSAVERPPAVGSGLDAGGEAMAGDEGVRGVGGAFQPAGVDVHQRQR